MMKTERFHQPAFPDEIVSFTEVAKNGIVFDCYGGDAGYGELLLSAYAGLRYYYFDIDNTAVTTASARLSRFGSRAQVKKANCRYLEKRIIDEGLSEIDCVIYDPGLRLEYIENPKRGFIIKQTGPLDGRYDQDQEETIGDILNHTPVSELTEIFRVVEIPNPHRIAQAVKEYREKIPFSSTAELSTIVFKAIPYFAQRRKVSPEILIILALRIKVNDELNALREALEKGFRALKKGGRLLTISYHSGEARIYKEFARRFDERYADDAFKCLRVLTKKAVKASDAAIRENPLIRSAQFRAYEKIK
jgi:16S rRNA (cytosine1402-N4)-methyltransferase